MLEKVLNQALTDSPVNGKASSGHNEHSVGTGGLDDGTRRPPVSSNNLRAWVRDRNVDGWSQDRIVKGAVAAFPQHAVPGRPELRKVDAFVREEAGLPARTRGRGKTGQWP